MVESHSTAYYYYADAMASQLNNVRLKLEQRRKRIEEEKKKMESIMARQREKVGQEAFLRAVGVKASSSSSTASVSSTNSATTTNSSSLTDQSSSTVILLTMGEGSDVMSHSFGAVFRKEKAKIIFYEKWLQKGSK